MEHFPQNKSEGSTSIEKEKTYQNLLDRVQEITDLGNFAFDPNEDEISSADRRYKDIESKIEQLLNDFKAFEDMEKEKLPQGYTMSSEFLDQTSYLKGRLASVRWVLEKIQELQNFKIDPRPE